MITTVPCPARCTVRLVDAGVIEKSVIGAAAIVTLADADWEGFATLVAVIVTGLPAVDIGAMYVAEVDDVDVKVPRQAGPKSQADRSVHETPRLFGSGLTAAVKTWDAPSFSVAAGGEIVTVLTGVELS